MIEQASSAPASLQALIAAPFDAIVDRWESVQPVLRVDPELIARAPDVMDAVVWLTGRPGLGRLRSAITARDEHAVGALVQLAGYLGMACDSLIERCKRWRREERWTTLRHEAALAARLAAAARRDRQRALALVLLANAYRALGDVTGTIEAYEAAIPAAAGDERLLAVANDNLGNALADIGKLDEALDHYTEALIHEHDPKGRRAVLGNQSRALQELGELRSAAWTTREAVAELERAKVGGSELAVTLDNAAIPVARLGEPLAALTMLARARELFAPDDVVGRAANALSRSEAHEILGDHRAAAEAFVQAHDLAFEDARRRIDPAHYRQGFLAARATMLPPDHEVNRWFAQAIAAKDAGAWEPALELLQRAAGRAREAGDHALALRIGANAAALSSDELGKVDQAFTIATRVRHEAAERGLARPELMAIGTLGTIAAVGADLHETLGPLGNFVTAAVLLEVHAGIVAASGLSPAEQKFETYDPGMVALELALQAEAHHADALATRYFREAIDKARASEAWTPLANRLAGLSSLLARSGDAKESDAVADELTAVLARGVLSERGQLVVHRALGLHLAGRDRTAAIDHLRKACGLLEGLCRSMAAGAGRADIARQFHGIHRTLARLLREAGDDTASFEALQGDKGRRLIDALAALSSGDAPAHDAPPKTDEVLAHLARLSGEAPCVLVDLVAGHDGLTAYVCGDGGVRTVHVDGDPSSLAIPEAGDVVEREARMVELCLRDARLARLAGAVTSMVPPGRRLLIAADQFLHNLPLHIVPVNGRPWCDHYSIGYLAATGTLRFAPRRRPAVGRSLVAGDSRGDLPQAAEECTAVAAALGSTPLVGPACTRAAIEDRLKAGELDVVHLALHGRGDTRHGGRASLLLADGMGGTEWVAFDELAAIPWRAELVVFSGCSTAVAGPRLGSELVGVARAAAERGAAAVIACLWPVADDAARVFMTAFYDELAARRAAGAVDLRVVLDDARRALRAWLPAASATGARRRDGRSRSVRPAAMPRPETPPLDPVVADALAWAPFILLGDPILGD